VIVITVSTLEVAVAGGDGVAVLVREAEGVGDGAVVGVEVGAVVLVGGGGSGGVSMRGIEVGSLVGVREAGGGLGVMRSSDMVTVGVGDKGTETMATGGKNAVKTNQARPLQTKIQIASPKRKTPLRPIMPYREVSRVIGPTGWRPRKAAKIKRGPINIKIIGRSKINKTRRNKSAIGTFYLSSHGVRKVSGQSLIQACLIDLNLTTRQELTQTEPDKVTA
jgi:hypothetical protein